VVTQNPDGLHQRAGSAVVREIHGTGATLSCMACGSRVAREELDAEPPAPPRCSACGGVLRPDVTFFGEMLPEGEIRAAQADCATCDVLVVVGTSAEVEPAASLPAAAADAGARVWEVNPAASAWLPAHRRLTAPAEEALPPVAERLGA
jgi:NAD-dependent deacetylase